jgi:hypothetical protein
MILVAGSAAHGALNPTFLHVPPHHLRDDLPPSLSISNIVTCSQHSHSFGCITSLPRDSDVTLTNES